MSDMKKHLRILYGSDDRFQLVKETIDVEEIKEGDILIPFSSVIAMGDFLVVAEEDII